MNASKIIVLKKILTVFIVLSFIGALTSLSIYLFLNKKLTKTVSDKELLVLELTSATNAIDALEIEKKEAITLNKKYNIENENLSIENTSLSEKNFKTLNQLAILNENYNNTLKEKHSLLNIIDTLKTEKDALIEQVKTLESDSFITNTIKEKNLLEIELKKTKHSLKEKLIENQKMFNNANIKYDSNINKANSYIKKLEKDLDHHKKESEKVKLLKFELNKLGTEKDILQTKFETLEKDKLDLVDIFSKQLSNEKLLKVQEISKNEKASQQYNLLKHEYNKIKTDISFLETNNQTLKSVIKQKEDKNKLLKNSLNNSNSSLKQRMQELARTQDTLKSIITKTRASVIDLDNQNDAIDLEKIVITLADKTIEQKEPIHYLNKKQLINNIPETILEARIIEIDYNYSFIVFDAGSRHGVKKDMKLLLKNNKENKPLLDAEILEIRQDITAVNLDAINTYNLKKGDLIQLRNM